MSARRVKGPPSPRLLRRLAREAQLCFRHAVSGSNIGCSHSRSIELEGLLLNSTQLRPTPSCCGGVRETSRSLRRLREPRVTMITRALEQKTALMAEKRLQIRYRHYADRPLACHRTLVEALNVSGTSKRPSLRRARRTGGAATGVLGSWLLGGLLSIDLLTGLRQYR